VKRKKEKILIVEKYGDDLKHLFHGDEFEIFNAKTIEEFKENILDFNPSLIIGDFQKNHVSGDICRIVKRDEMMRHIPFIIISESSEISHRINAADSGASDYIIKPFEREEALARINRSIRDMKHALNANPLTKLPGNIAIHDKLETLIVEKQPLAIAYFDLDNFKAYNDTYGYSAGDRIISHCASLILKCRDDLGADVDDFFIGHVGGDDFIMICKDELIEEFCKNYVEKFDAMVPFEYDEETAKVGHIIGKDRQGRTAVFPLMSISIAVVVNEGGDKFRHVGEIASAGAEIKKYLKSHSGSSFLIDRRR